MTRSRNHGRARRPLVPAAVFAALLAAIFGSAFAPFPAQAQVQGRTPTEAGQAPYWRFQRHDLESLRQLGGGDLTAGLNKLGEVGFELFIVTSGNDQGAAGWLYLRQSPWTTPMPRPGLEYRVLDDPQITGLGNGNYADGLTSLGRDGWQLVAITVAKGGASGWTFFMRERPAAAPVASPAPVPADPPAQSAGPAATPAPTPTAAPTPLPSGASPGPAADFSSPRAAVQTLIAAAAARDAQLLSQCFAETAAKEFAPLRARTASVRELDDLAALFEGATVTEERAKVNRTATVAVKLRSRNEEIELVRDGDRWQVVDF